MAIIAKNNTGSRILINDLGVFIDSSSSVDLTEIFEKEEIASSKDLYNYVYSGDFTINDGTQDLNISNGLKHITIQTEWEDIEIVPPHSIGSHTDVSISSPYSKQKITYDSTSHIWINKASEVSSGSEPPDDPQDGDLWFPESGNLPWMWSQGEWITIYRSIMTYSKGGKASGEYLTIGGWVSADFYWFSQLGRVCSLYTRALAGDDTKGFQLQDGRTGEILYEWNFPGGGVLEYKNLNINIPVSYDTLQRCYVKKEGAQITNVLVQVEIAWRYT